MGKCFEGPYFRKHEVFDITAKYWKTGNMSKVYQTYLDVCKEIEISNLLESEQAASKKISIG